MYMYSTITDLPVIWNIWEALDSYRVNSSSLKTNGLIYVTWKSSTAHIKGTTWHCDDSCFALSNASDWFLTFWSVQCTKIHFYVSWSQFMIKRSLKCGGLFVHHKIMACTCSPIECSKNIVHVEELCAHEWCSCT